MGLCSVLKLKRNWIFMFLWIHSLKSVKMPFGRGLTVMKTLILTLGTALVANGCDSPEHCVNMTCHFEKSTPMCTYGCVAGFAGNLCKEYCFHKCVACDTNDSERCTRCDKGLFGNKCESRCPNCLNSSCHINGSCVEGCKSSWWGPACTETCPGDCQEECEIRSGECITDMSVTFRTSSQVEQSSISMQKTEGSLVTESMMHIICALLSVASVCLVLLIVLVGLAVWNLIELRKRKKRNGRGEVPLQDNDNYVNTPANEHEMNSSVQSGGIGQDGYLTVI